MRRCDFSGLTAMRSVVPQSRPQVTGFLLAVFSLFLLPLSSLAQMNTGTILGTVTDPSGAAVPNAQITITNTGMMISTRLQSDSNGNYAYSYLIPGTYSVLVAKAGFTKVLREGIALDVDQKARLDIALQVGSQSQTVSVTEAAPLVATDSSESGQVITAQQIVSLPLNIRNFAQLASLTTGTVPNHNSLGGTDNNPDNPQGISDTNVNGIQQDANNWQIDGISNNEVFFRILSVNPSVDAIEEFKVATNNYSAEFGSAGGANVQISLKSGTNQFHGVGFEFLRNSVLDANDFFSNASGAPRLAFKQNQFGGNIGGPILKDRTFFFADYEGYRSRQQSYEIETVPTVLQRQGNFTEPGNNLIYNPLSLDASGNPTPFPGNTIPSQLINQTSANILKLLPTPNLNVPVGQPNYYGTSNASHNTDNFDVRVDHHISDRNQIFGRYSFLNTKLDSPPFLGVQAGGDPFLAARAHTRNQNGVVSDTFSISPTTVNEARFGVNRVSTDWFAFDEGANTSTQVGIPGINGTCSYCGGLARIVIAGLNPYGHTPYSPTLRHETVFQWVDNVTFNRGKHTIKTGAEFRRVRGDVFQTANPLGEFDFDGNFTSDLGASGTGMGAASFLLGYPTFAGRAAISTFPSNRASQIAAFVQDDYRVTRHLTLNLGLRYEYYTTITDAHHNLSQFDLASGDVLLACVAISCSGGIQGDKKDFSPRVGFAYSPDNGKTAIRGGFGTSYFYPQAGFLVDNFPFVQGQGYTPANTFTLNPLTDPMISNGLPPPPPVEQRPGAPAGHLVPTGGASGNGFTSVNYLDPNTKISRVYQWSFDIQRQLGQNMLVDLGYVGNSANHLSVDVPGNFPQPGQNLTDAAGNSLSLQQRRPYYSVDPDLASIDRKLWVGLSNYESLQAKFQKRFSNGLNFLASYTRSKALQRGVNFQDPSNYMATKGAANFDTPQRFVVSFNYDLPFGRRRQFGQNWNPLVNGALGNWQLSGIYSIQSGQPFMPSFSGTLDNGNGNYPNRSCDGKISNWTIREYYSFNCFSAPGINQFGNSAYNPLYGPAFRDLDLSLMKNFVYTEQRYLQLRAEFFNLPNNENFGQPNSFQCGGACGEGIITSSASGSNPRQIQFALKLYF